MSAKTYGGYEMKLNEWILLPERARVAPEENFFLRLKIHNM